MKLDLDSDINHQNRIHSYESDKIVVNNTILTGSFILFPDKVINEWRPACITELEFNDLNIILDENPELLLIGTGQSLIFPAPKIIAKVQELNIGLEIMDSGAACRCFNLLLSENRFIVAAMFI